MLFALCFAIFSCNDDDEKEPPIPVAKFRSKSGYTLSDIEKDEVLTENFSLALIPSSELTPPVTVKERVLTYFSDDTFECKSSYRFSYGGSAAKAESAYYGTFTGGREAAKKEGPIDMVITKKFFSFQNNTIKFERNQTKLHTQITPQKTFSSAYAALYLEDFIEEGNTLSSGAAIDDAVDAGAKKDKDFDATVTGLDESTKVTIADLGDEGKGSGICTVLGKSTADLVSIPISFKYDEAARTVKVFGRLKKVSDYTGFAVNPDYQAGYFLPILLKSNAECYGAICDSTKNPIAGKVLHLVAANPDIKAPGKDTTAVTKPNIFCDAHIVRIADAAGARATDQTTVIAFSSTNTFSGEQENYIIIDFSAVEI